MIFRNKFDYVAGNILGIYIKIKMESIIAIKVLLNILMPLNLHSQNN